MILASATPASAIIWCSQCDCDDNCWRPCFIDGTLWETSNCGTEGICIDHPACSSFAAESEAVNCVAAETVFGDDAEGQQCVEPESEPAQATDDTGEAQ